jgi:murein DD-endopeptidase MepM/ murein hydrolase activator NlpD
MFHNPTQGPRIVPFGEARTRYDVLPNGRPGFRVTQRFADWDVYLHKPIHGAIDIGNFYCGDSILAMLRGVCTVLKDPNGAIGVEIRHPNGWRSQYWHLSKVNVVTGQSVYRGRRIGWVGSTGLDIGGCHCHIVAINPSGVKVDPWPLLYQNQ